MVSIMMLRGSINVPSKNRINCITIMTNIGCTGRWVAISTRPVEAPVKARICEKAVEPARIMNIITDTLSVPSVAFLTTFQRSRRYAPASTKQPSVPAAAGEASPWK